MVYDLVAGEGAETKPILKGSVQSFDMATDAELIHIVWATFFDEERELYHLILDSNLEVIDGPNYLHSSYRPLGRILVVPETNLVLWSELTNKGFAMFATPLTKSKQKPIQLSDFGTPAEPHSYLMGEDGNIHLLWNKLDRILLNRELNYTLLTPELEILSTVILGDTSLQETPSGSMILNDGILHVAWTQVRQGSLGGRKPVSIKYQSFSGGKPQSDAVWISDTIMRQPSLGVGKDGELLIVWSEDAGDLGGLEIHYATLSGASLTDVQRLTWSTHPLVLPNLFKVDGYSYVLFQQITRSDRILKLINNQYPQIPSLWQQLGFDSQNISGSMVFKIGNAFVLAGVSALMLVIPILAATMVIVFLHKKLGSPRTMPGFLLQLLLVCTLVFLQLAVFEVFVLQPVFVTPIYQLNLFAIISLIVITLFGYFGKGTKDEPALYGGAAFLWLFLWFFMTAMTRIPLKKKKKTSYLSLMQCNFQHR
jgi:hypothetical protein